MVSHLGSCCEDFAESLNRHPQIEIHRTGLVYSHVQNLYEFFPNKHKFVYKNSYFGDILYYNHQISSKWFYKNCKFIYVIDKPEYAISEIIDFLGVSLKEAELYYNMRLRRLVEMSNYTDGVLISNGVHDLKLIEDYLGLKTKIEKVNIKNKKLTKVSNYCSESYERYLFKIKNRKLIF